MCFTLKLVFVSFYCPLSPTSLFNSCLSVISVIELILLKPISSLLFSSTFLSSLIPSILHLPAQIQTLINSDWRREVRDITPHWRHIGVRITSFPKVNIQQSHWKLSLPFILCVSGFNCRVQKPRGPRDPPAEWSRLERWNSWTGSTGLDNIRLASAGLWHRMCDPISRSSY